MKVELTPARVHEKATLANLLELYLYDFTDFEDEDVDEQGRFGYDYLDSWWSEDARFPFLLRVDDRLAGFVLLRRLPGEPPTMEVSEFFVMRKYRRRGVGEYAARWAFDRFPGRWEVHELERNTGAQRFWRAVIGRCTEGRFEEHQRDDGAWRGPVQLFDNTAAGER